MTYFRFSLVLVDTNLFQFDCETIIISYVSHARIHS